jgi:molybdopterin-guanine dinucleotide biosynthesis protein A
LAIEMRLLGALIAGGASRRFGSDKALATIGGVSLIEHARGALEAQVDELVLCGRPSNRMRWISDRPAPGLGPLGGLNAALPDARARGYDAVVTVPVDVFPLPLDLVGRLGLSGPCVFATQHLIGLWPADLGHDWICTSNPAVVHCGPGPGRPMRE